jgi:ribosomal protein S12 methylthiotransferase
MRIDHSLLNEQASMIENSPSIGFVSLGCPKATVDSEKIITQLQAEGYLIAPSYQGADLVVVNTCGFIDEAIDESLDAITEALAENGRVIVTGCLGARESVIREHCPEILAVTGPDATDEVLNAVHTHLAPPHSPYTSLIPPGGVKLTPRHYGYLKISEGCNHHCTFCVIPALRGRLESRPLEEVMSEAEALVTAGVRELIVVSQDTSAYGVDLGHTSALWRGEEVNTSLVDLARELGELGVWIRLHYIYPYPNVDQLLPLMAEGKILPYLDVPLQHASPIILKAMKRPADIDNTLERIRGWRSVCSELAIRSTFIVGFPGETEQDFEELLDFVTVAELDRVGAFIYSPVEGASANQLAGSVDPSLQEERLSRLMALQCSISKAKLKNLLGDQMRVLVDKADEEGIAARSYANAPEVDGQIHLDAVEGIAPGDFIDVEITGSDDHDLFGRAINHPADL